MINYIINREEKTIELLSGSADIDEIKDLIKLFKGYKFFIAPKIERQGLLVGGAYVNIPATIEHN